MLWVKAFHIIFVVAWYAGLLYLPRLFVYHAETEDSIGHERFKVMERKLFMIMTVGGIGGARLRPVACRRLCMGGVRGERLVQGEAPPRRHARPVPRLVRYTRRRLRRGHNGRGHRFYRLINEVPALILLAMVILVVVKPAMGVLDG